MVDNFLCFSNIHIFVSVEIILWVRKKHDFKLSELKEDFILHFVVYISKQRNEEERKNVPRF